MSSMEKKLKSAIQSKLCVLIVEDLEQRVMMISRHAINAVDLVTSFRNSK